MFNEIRDLDNYGSGHLGAPRGNRPHLGVDIITLEGEPIYAPFPMTVERISYPYVGDTSLRGIAFTTQINGVSAIGRAWYFSPRPDIIGSTVGKGELLGYANTLQKKYKGITDHVHWQLQTDTPVTSNAIQWNGKWYNDITVL